jgi:hypothetical protein
MSLNREFLLEREREGDERERWEGVRERGV